MLGGRCSHISGEGANIQQGLVLALSFCWCTNIRTSGVGYTSETDKTDAYLACQEMADALMEAVIANVYRASTGKRPHQYTLHKKRCAALEAVMLPLSLELVGTQGCYIILYCYYNFY